jgi:serine/threonine protein kinase
MFSFNRDPARQGDDLRSKGQFEKAAEAYRKAKRLDQAGDMYAQAGKIERAVETYREAGLPLTAARLLAQAGRLREAISLFREAGALSEAAEASQGVGQMEQAAQLFEQAGAHDRAADCWVQLGDTPRAVSNLERAVNELRHRSDLTAQQEARLRDFDLHRAELLGRLGRDLEAARLLLRYDLVNRAGQLFAKGGDPGLAIKSYLDAGLVDEALALAQRHPEVDAELRVEAYLNAGRHLEGGTLLEQLGKLDAAASAFEAANEWAHAAKLYEEIGSFAHAADLYYRVERFYDAGRCFARSSSADKSPAERRAVDVRAADAFLRAGAFGNAADAYMSAEMPLRAAELYQRAGRENDALNALGSIEPEHPDYLRAMAALVPLLLDLGRVEAAEMCLHNVKNNRQAFKRWEVGYLQARREEALGHYDEAERLYKLVIRDRADFRDAADRLRDVRGRFMHLPPLEDSAALPSMPVPVTSVEPVAGRPQTVHATQKIPLKPSPASTGAVGKPQPAAEPKETTSRSTISLIELPVTIEAPVESWWTGAAFFRATDTRKGKPVLLVSFPMAEIGERVPLFRQIMRQVTALQHKSILKLEETLLASDKVLLLYEACEAETLASALGRGRRFPPSLALHLLMQLCEALTNAHKLGVTHQWLSPRTILVDQDARCKVVGIGLREFLASRDSTSLAYLSPEVIEDGLVGPSTDVYSLGLLAMELLKVRVPANWRQQAVLDPGTFGWPPEVRDEVPASVRDTLVRCLTKDPLHRPTTAEIATSLASFGLIPGQLLNDRFEIRSELGRGGMSRVYRAYDQLAGEEVAIKILISPGGGSEEEERLRRELQICRRIVHPNVVRVYDIGRYSGGIFVHMELLNGPGLDHVIREEAPVDPQRVRKLLIEIAAALCEAHRLKIVHRDLKPGNVIVVDGRAKVLDFGIARMNDGTSADLTRTGEVIGSPMYMSPEQIQGLALNGTCDLYALGVIAFTLLAGREPFTGDSTTAIVLKHLQEAPPDIRQFQPTLAEAWVLVLARLLAKKPQQRYQSAEELIQVLERIA